MASIDLGARVTDTKGESFQTKFVQPVSADSKSVPDTKVPKTRDINKVAILQPLANQLMEHLGPNTETSISNARGLSAGLA